MNKKVKNIGALLVEVTEGWQIGEILWMRVFVDPQEKSSRSQDFNYLRVLVRKYGGMQVPSKFLDDLGKAFQVLNMKKAISGQAFPSFVITRR